MSTEDGSNAPPSESWKLEPSSTGPVFENVAVGATLVTVTVSVYSVVPPSLSRISAATERVPLSDVRQVAVASAENAP